MKKWLLVVVITTIALTACGADTTLLETNPEEVLQQASDLQTTDQDEVVDNGTDDNSAEQTDDVQNEEDMAQDEGQMDEGSENLEPTPTPAQVFEVVPVPLIDLGDNWFQPVNPLEVDLNSGDYQLIDFSAFW